MSENALSGILGLRPGALCIINSSRDLVESAATWNNCTTTSFCSILMIAGVCGAGSLTEVPARPWLVLCARIRRHELLVRTLSGPGRNVGCPVVEDKLSLLAASPQAVQ